MNSAANQPAEQQENGQLLEEQKMALIQASQQNMIDQNQFSDYLMQFKNKIVSQVNQEANPGLFNNANASNVKPLGFDKEKALAALKNLQSGSLTPKGSSLHIEKISSALQMPASSGLAPEAANQFNAYKFFEAQN